MAGEAVTSPVTHCLDHALRILRAGTPAVAVSASLSRVPAECQRPDVCGHQERGCRAVNREWLRESGQRLRRNGKPE